MPRSGRHSDTSFRPREHSPTLPRGTAYHQPHARAFPARPYPAFQRLLPRPRDRTLLHAATRDQAHQRCAWSAAPGSAEGAVGFVARPRHADACPRLPRCLNGSASVGKPSSLTWCCRSSAVSGYQALPLDSDHTNSKPTAACSVCLHSTYARQPPLTALPGHPAARFALRITRLRRDPHRSRLRRWPG